MERDDPRPFLDWARIHRPELVRIKEEANIAEAKRVLSAAATRAIVPETGEVHYSVKVEG